MKVYRVGDVEDPYYTDSRLTYIGEVLSLAHHSCSASQKQEKNSVAVSPKAIYTDRVAATGRQY